MTMMRNLFKRQGAGFLGCVLFAAAMLFVFADVLPKYVALAAPDSGPFFQYGRRTAALEALLGGQVFTPQALYWLSFPPLYMHDLTFVIDTLFLVLAGVYYLKGRRVHPLAAWGGGLALGLCGYTFTLFCAGHRGYFHMFSSAVWAFGLLVRCFETRRLFYFAMLGLVLAWGAAHQPDVLVLVGAVAASYALWLTARPCPQPQAGGWGRGVGRTVLAVWPRFLLSVAVLLLAGFGSLRAAMTTTMASRDAQIASVTGTDQTRSATAGGQPDKARHERWLFATGWSLPPEDVLEFVAPGVFGDASMQMPHPYWGRLGRPAEEVFQKGRMMPNYRQHTVYLGVVSVLFALFAVVAYPARKREETVAATASCSDVPFWCGVWAVCLVLAFGRYTPLYRLFYSIPYMDYIRAPVKFHHLVEIATAFLAGFGLDAFLRGSVALRRRLVWLAVGLAAVLFVGAALMLASKGAVEGHIASLGLGQAAQGLSGFAVHNLMRSVGLSALVAGLAWAAARAPERTLAKVACLTLAVLVLDLALVARRYVHPINVEPFYRKNAAVAAISRETGGRFVNVVNYVTPNAIPQEWFSTAFALNGIRNLMPGGDERSKPSGKLFEALQRDPLRLWRLWGVEYVIVPRKGGEALLRSGALKPLLDFELGQGALRQVPPGENSCTLARVRDAAPLPRFVTAWVGGVPADAQAEAASQEKSLDVSDAPAPAAAGAEASSVRLLEERGQPGRFQTRVHVSAKSPGLLIFNERLVPGLEVWVDGVAGKLQVADGCWVAACVPEGEHEVSLRMQRSLAFPLAGLLIALGALAWGGVSLLRGARDAAGGDNA